MISVTRFFSLAVAASGLLVFGCQPEEGGALNDDVVASMKFEQHQRDAPISIKIDDTNSTSLTCETTQTWDDLFPESPGREFESNIVLFPVQDTTYAHGLIGESTLEHVLVPFGVRGKIREGELQNLWVAPWGGNATIACAGLGQTLTDVLVVTGEIPTTESFSSEDARSLAAENVERFGLRSITDIDLSYEEVPLPPGPVEEE